MRQKYEITIRGQLTSEWREIFEGMDIACLDCGGTCISGEVPDQAALYGLLMQLRDLGMTLISVNPEPDQPSGSLPAKDQKFI